MKMRWPPTRCLWQRNPRIYLESDTSSTESLPCFVFLYPIYCPWQINGSFDLWFTVGCRVLLIPREKARSIKIFVGFSIRPSSPGSI